MKKKFEYTERKGLPGGPNEYVTHVSGMFSMEGYKRNSPDVNNPYNIIPSGNITMEDVDFPVMGTDNLGNSQAMTPGNDYQFPGDMVFETPMAQAGVEVPKRRGVRLNYDDKGNVVSESTHIMATETDGKGNWFSFPTLFQNSIPYADDSKNWVDMSDRPWEEAYEEAKKRNEVIEFGKDKEAAIKFGEGSWKPKMKRGGGLLTKTMKCNNCSWEWKAADGGNDVSTCHKCGSQALPKAQDGVETTEPWRIKPVIDPAMFVAAAKEQAAKEKKKQLTGAALEAHKRNPKFKEQANKNNPEFRDFKGIPFLSSIAAGDIPGADQHHNSRLADLYRYYAGRPLEDDILQVSNTKPTKAQDPDAKYISLNKNQQLVQEVIDNYNRVSNGNFYTNKTRPDLILDPDDNEKQLDKNNYKVTGYREVDDIDDHQLNAIGNYFTGFGEDENGTYISYYDKFDQAGGLGGSINVGEELGLTKPFEIYDRIYVEKDKDSGKYIQKKKGGGSILKAQGGIETEPWKPKPAIDPAMFVQAAKEFKAKQKAKQLSPEAIEAVRRSPDYKAIKESEAQRDEIIRENYRRSQEEMPAGPLGYKLQSDNASYNPNSPLPYVTKKYESDQGEIGEYVEPSNLDRIGDVLANPLVALSEFTKYGYVPSNLGYAESSAMEQAIDLINPAAWGQMGEEGLKQFGEGDYAEGALGILSAIPAFKGLGKGLNKNLSKFVNNNPKLNFILDSGNPFISTKNLTYSPGLKADDFISGFVNPETFEYTSGLPMSNFFNTFGQGGKSLNNSIQKRISDLKSNEGFNRLVRQEYLLLKNKNLPKDVNKVKLAKQRAFDKIKALENSININDEALKYSKENLLGSNNPYILESKNVDNAFYTPQARNFINNRKNIDLEDYLNYEKLANYEKLTELFTDLKKKPGISIGYNYVNNKPVEMHEIGHFTQDGEVTYLDKQLQKLTPKKNLSYWANKAYDYFKNGGKGKNPSLEPLAFANELREAMYQKGFISDYYSPFDENLLKKAYKYFKKNPMGVYNKKDGEFLSATRIFDFIEPDDKNFTILSDVFNELPVAIPAAIGLGAAGLYGSQSNEEQPEYQTGGENIYGYNPNYLSKEYEEDEVYKAPGLPEIEEYYEKPLTYKVKAGDNLSRIAKANNTTVGKLVELNQIDNPRLINIGQTLNIPKNKYVKEETPTEDEIYTVKAGDTLSALANTYNTSVQNLAQYNNIDNPSSISVNQKIKIPSDTRKNVPEKEEQWYEVDILNRNTKEINKLGDENIIKKSQSIYNPNQQYVIVDKKTQRLKLYQGKDVLMDFEVNTGAKKGDAQTVTKMRDLNNDFKTTDADKINGKWEVDWSRGNLNTGAGRYTIFQTSPTSKAYYNNAPSFNLLNDRGDAVSTAIHGAPDYRLNYFDNESLDDNRSSNGCVNGKCSDLQALYNMNLPEGTPVYILPEDEGNNFEIIDGKPVLRMSRKNRKKYAGLYKQDEDKGPLMMNWEKGQGANYSVNTLTYKPIKTELNDKFKESVLTKTYTVGGKKYKVVNDKQKEIVDSYLKGMEDNKQKIMVEAKVPGDVYNQLVKMSFAIFGVESSFGKENNVLENLAKAGQKKTVSVLNEILPESLELGSVSSPDPLSKYNTYGVTGDENSVGYTQIRWNDLSDKEKEVLAELDVTSNADFLDPKKVGAATVAILAIRYNMQLTPDEKKNIWDHLPVKWNKAPNYPDRVKRVNNKYLKVKQLDKLEKGGEVDDNMDNVMYKNYINGVYNNTSMEEEAANVYDKLNRVYYNKAKQNNMSVPNYIMSNVIR